MAYLGKGILILVWLVIVPVLLGKIVCDFCKTRENVISYYLTGSFAGWAVFEAVAVPAIMVKWKLDPVILLWCLLILAILSTGFVLTVGKKKGQGFSEWRHALSERLLGKKLRPAQMAGESWFTKILLAGVIVLIAVQIYMYVFYAHYDADDARYMANSVSAWNNGTMLLTHPNTGVMLAEPVGELKKDVVSPWVIWLSMLAKLTCIHPTILAHTVLPVFLVLMGYGAYFLLARTLLKERRYQYLFLLLVCVFELFGYISIYAGATFFLTRIWQGKSIVAGVLLPFLIALMLQFEADYENPLWHILIGTVNLGACLLSGVGIVYSAVLVGCFEFSYALQHKSWKNLLLGILSCLPNLVFGILYAMS